MNDDDIDFGATVPLLAVSPSCASVWRVRAGGGRGLDTVARRAWRDASVALSRSIPVWPPRARWAHEQVPEVELAGRPVPKPGRVAEIRGDLDGASFGLAFVFIQAARVLEREPDPYFAPAAQVDPTGLLKPVAGLAEKAAALAKLGHEPDCLLVARGQKDGVAEAEALGFAVERHDTAATAIAQAFPNYFESLAQVQDPKELRSLVRSLFYLAVGQRRALVDWTPVSATAAALSELPSVRDDANNRARVAYARAFSLRRQGQHGPCELPDEALLKTLRLAERWKLYAQLLQHAADTGSPDPDRMLELVESAFPASEMDWLEEHVEMAGARARLWAARGEPERAFDDQMLKARLLLEFDRPTSATYQLAEGFRLAGALGCRDRLQRVQELLDAADDMEDLRGTHGIVYVDVAKARALWMLGEHERAIEIVLPLHQRQELPEHVVMIALRVLIGALESAGNELGARREREELDGHAKRTDRFGDDAVRARELVRLDDALRTGDAVDFPGFLARFGQAQPLGQLLKTRPPKRWPNEAEYVARFYPY